MLIKYTGKYVKIYFIIKITFSFFFFVMNSIPPLFFFADRNENLFRLLFFRC